MQFRRVLASLALTSLVLLPVLAGAVAPATGAVGQSNATGPNPCVGTIERAPNGTTVVSVQGIEFGGTRYVKRPALAVGFGPGGGFEYAYNATARGRFWAYDVDPTREGLLLATTEPGTAVAESVVPATGDRRWVERLGRTANITVATDIDRLPNGNLLVADSTTGTERLLVYDPETDEVVWEWRFDGQPGFPRSGGGEYGSDWVHVNDVDRVGPGAYLASARNFDQVIVVNRSTRNVTLRLGADDAFRFLNRPSNPQLLRTEAGRPAVLVADGRNDRVVEWTRVDGNWTRTWTLLGGGLNGPRDADRLPNGNTLVVDRRGHRVMEVTPAGRVVWEVYAPWQPYDAERVRLGDEPGGPAAADLGTNTTVELTNSAAFDQNRVARCAAALQAFAPTREERLLGAFGLNASTATGAGAAGGAGLQSLAVGGAAVVAVALGAGYLLRD